MMQKINKKYFDKNPKPENIPKTNQYEFLFVVILSKIINDYSAKW